MRKNISAEGISESTKSYHNDNKSEKAILAIVVFSLMPTLIAKSQNLEKAALIYFADSILYHDHTFLLDDGSITEEFRLLPPDLEEILVRDGLFKGIKVYSDGIVDRVSTPYIDSVTFASNYYDFAENRRKILRSYIEDWKQKKGLSLKPFIILLPNRVERFNFEDFKCDEESLFLTVSRHISSTDAKMVEISLYDRNRESSYEFYLFLDQNQKVIEWQIK